MTSPIIFGTKAETLERLAGRVTQAALLPQVRFTVRQWLENPSKILERIGGARWADGPLIVRSSALTEDGVRSSQAGRFLSILHVSGEEALKEAIRRVIASYGDRNEADQVFVQPMLKDVRMNGVAFSRDPNSGGPYRVINYDATRGSTTSVTSGTAAELRTFYCHRSFDGEIPSSINRVIALMSELESLLESDQLDIEFALDGQGTLCLLQARRLMIPHEEEVSPENHLLALRNIERRVRELSRPHPYLHGSRTVFGIMPDWNPAEIIGVRPRPLALSLYKELVTDNIWAYQRDNYGYKNLRSFPLLINFAGLPYIDARVDFNSFIPASVGHDLSERLADYYIDQLIGSPSHHDKVEFEILYTCYTFDLPERLRSLSSRGFSDEDLALLSDSLRNLTNGILHREKGLWKKDIEKIYLLNSRQTAVLRSSLDTISKIYWLIEDCKRYGTLPFAGLARAGFIAVQMLKSLVSVGVFTHRDIEGFMGTLDTVSSRMARDLTKLTRGEFLKRYGHLRPGTYDILSPRYDEEPERYFDWSHPPSSPPKVPSRFEPTPDQVKEIERLLKDHRIEHDATELFEFLRGAIEGREFAKFIFTRSLSDALSLFKTLGAEHGLSREDCSLADISCIRDLYASSGNIGLRLKLSVDQGKQGYALTRQICLPPLITNPSDVWAFEMLPSEPNFITLGKASGHVTFTDHDQSRLKGSILFIPSADPGYDWIFTRQIAGFITKYGGVNSHMAIRAGEMQIPAVIGAGETLYSRWSSGRTIEIDCPNRQVRVL